MEVTVPLKSGSVKQLIKVSLKGKKWGELKEMSPTIKNQFFLPSPDKQEDEKVRDSDYFWKIELIEVIANSRHH